MEEKNGNSPYRAQPDFMKQFIITTEASNSGISTILAQKDEQGRKGMILYFSRAFLKAVWNYCVTTLKLLAVVNGLEHYRHSSLGRELKLETPLQNLHWYTILSKFYGLIAQMDIEISWSWLCGRIRPRKRKFRWSSE